MKKKFLLTLFVLVVGFMGLMVYAAEIVEDENDNQQQYVEVGNGVTLGDIEQHFDLSLWGAILEVLPELSLGDDVRYLHVADITSLNLSNRNLESLDGLGHLTALIWLNVSYNNLDRLHLPYNVALTHINASNNKLAYVDLRANVNLMELDLRNNELAEGYEMELILPFDINLTADEIDEFLFVLPPEPLNEHDYDNQNDDRVRVDDDNVKEVIFGAIDWDEVNQGDGSDQTLYLSVTLAAGVDRVWFARTASVIEVYEEEVEDPDEPGTLVTVFSWILVLAAILSFILSMVLFILRKE